VFVALTKKFSASVLFALLASAFPAAAQESAGDAASAVKILLTMERTYRNCTSYRDTGEVKTISRTDGGRFGSEAPFATAFVRPGSFRFQFTDRGLGERSSDYIVWLGGGELRSWWDAKPGVRRPESLQQALDLASGLSQGVSVRIPGFLLPSLVGSGPPLIAVERLADGEDRGVACFCIKGKSRETPYTLTMGARTITVKDENVTYWIDRATQLLRKVVEDRTFDTYRSQTTTTYDPEIDVEIAPGQLAFGEPAPPAP
jgi:hypothetical protein